MARDATTTGAERLVHCSPDRTVFTTTDPATGATTVSKLFVRGSPADAEREGAMARVAAGPGVVTGVRVTIDPATNRPRIDSAFAEGLDLSEFPSLHGAVPAALAVRHLAPVAHTLARLHALRTEQTPSGLCHGDVKPANLRVTDETTLLLDFEHAHPNASRPLGHPLGTVGFAAPEALENATPQPSLDVYGLGATLRWLLRGGDLAELPQDAEVMRLIDACTDPVPARRPTAADVADALDRLVIRLGEDHEEELLHRLARGERLEFVSDMPRFPAMRRYARHQKRLLERLPGILDRPETIPGSPTALRLALLDVRRVLRWFPRHEATLRHRRELASAALALLAETARTVDGHKREEHFDQAVRWLDDAIRLAELLHTIPGLGPIPGATDARALGLLQRDPIAFLRGLRSRVEEAHDELTTTMAKVDDAERELDLVAAEAAVTVMAERYGGSSPTVTRRRDQLHRLAFYLDRIAGAQPNVERIAQLWDATALAPLQQLVSACAARSSSAGRTDSPTEPLGLRSLQVTLINLAEEFPHLYERSGPALEALSQALDHSSDLAWNLIDKCRRQLEAVPVPVRPLQVTLGRLDTFRILEALVDRPDRPRSRLLDDIEAVRLEFEQARAARDRLAQGAEQAMERGHWTTGLFDMERAVESLNRGDADELEEAERLEARLREARRKKADIDAAVRRNVELGTRYGLLEDDPKSSFAQRLQVLTERRDCLHFLAVNLPTERSQLYSRDMREVELQITLENAGLAQREFDAAESETRRLELATKTIEDLENAATAEQFGGETPGRLQRLLEHWHRVAGQLKDQVDARRAAAQRARARRRAWIATALTLLTTATAVGWILSPWLFGRPAIASVDAPTIESLTSDCARLPERIRPAGERLLARVRETSSASPPFDVSRWYDTFAAALCAFAEGLAPDDDPARRFANRCWRTAFAHGDRLADEAGRKALAEKTDVLGPRLAPFGLEAPNR